MDSVEDVVAAFEDGGLVVIPTDTVYGLACRPDSEDAVRELSALKGARARAADRTRRRRDRASSSELIPELSGQSRALRGRSRSCCRTLRGGCPG